MRAEQAIDHLYGIFDEEIIVQREQKRKTDEQMASMRADYRDVFLGTAAGKRVLADLLNECGVFESNFTRYSANTFYNEGRSDIGLLLLNNCFNLDDRKQDNG
jgi:hypothetical protein